MCGYMILYRADLFSSVLVCCAFFFYLLSAHVAKMGCHVRFMDGLHRSYKLKLTCTTHFTAFVVEVYRLEVGGTCPCGQRLNGKGNKKRQL